jgi:hypothetical protein
MTETLDIVKLIEKNPITRLSQDYQSKLLNKIKDKFTDSQQQLFVSSFYCYLNHNSKNEFVIDLDDVWKWMGFSRKDPAKVVLDKNFIKDIDYKILLPVKEDKIEKHGGHNKEQILMNINTFKRFTLRANTKKANEIYDYYILFEQILVETINEETDELRNQLIVKDKIIKENDLQKKLDKHNLFLEKFKNKRCVYIAEIKENKYIKVGSTKDINTRINQLKRNYNNNPIYFLDVFECDNFREAEEAILSDSLFKENSYKEYIDGYKSKEVVLLSDTFKYEQFYSLVQKYINKVFLFSPSQILENEKIELENKKIDVEFLKLVINNPNYINTIQEIIKDKLPNIITSINTNNI